MGYPVAAVRGRWIPFAIPTVNFDPAAATFTPHMAKRTAPGPFAAAPIVQGDWASAGTIQGDYVIFPRGSQISGDFYANFDMEQGSVAFWITPEWDGDDGKQHYILPVAQGGNDFQLRKEANSKLLLYLNGNGFSTVDVSGWVAGTTYFVVLRWDIDNALDGSNYACISINDVHTYGIGSSPGDSGVPDTEIPIGNIRLSDGADLPLNAILEGLTVYRRPLYDGAHPAALSTLSDEINLIHASGAGKKPEEVTGGEDIVFALPTNGTAEELATGTGEAWSFPWADNELTNWHMQDQTGGAPDNWTAVNAPTLADAATADILFDTRSQKVSVDAADEGIKQAFAVSAGEDYYLGAWVKTGGANQGVDVRVYDATGAADVVELTTDSSSWVLLETCFEVPAGCNSIEVYIESTDADTYDMHVAQVQVLPNLFDDPGMEAGTAITGVGTPTTSEQSADQAHSGTNSWKIVADATDEGFKRAPTTTDGKYYLVSGWVYAATAGTVDMIAGGTTVTSSGNDAWKFLSMVILADAASEDVTFQSNAAQTFYVDDVSVITLTDVSLTVTPASEANSTENGGLRVDGLDRCIQDITGQLKATSGKVKFKWTPRHGGGDYLKFGSGFGRVLKVWNDATHYYELMFNGADNISIKINTGGGENTYAWAGTGLIAGTEYLFELQYTSADITLKVDGIEVVSGSEAINWGANIPDTVYWGAEVNGKSQSDSVFSAP